jgi:hypothetical protein
MEKFTLTQLYETLAQKIGRNEAEALTNYVNIKVKNEVDTKTEILATKLFVKDECHAIKEDIHALRSELKGDIHILRNEVTAGIHTLRNEMKEHSLSQQKWMLSIFITIVIMFMGLYATLFFKH